MKKIFSLLVALTLMCSVLVGTSVFAAGEPTFAMSSATAKAGEEVTLTVSVANNPGITALNLEVTFGDSLTLIGSEDNSLFGSKGTFSKTYDYVPYAFNWSDDKADYTDNGDLYTLTFKVADDAAAGNYEVVLSYDQENVYNVDFDDVVFETVNGVITVAGDDPTAESIGLKTDDTQILRLKDVKVNNNNGESYTVNTALGFVSCVNKDANATNLYTEINLEGWTGETLKIDAKNTTEIGDQIYFVAAVTSIREANLNKAFSAKAFATVDGKPVTDSNTVSATYNVQ